LSPPERRRRNCIETKQNLDFNTLNHSSRRNSYTIGTFNMAVPSDGSDFDFVRRMTHDQYVFPTDRLKQTCAPGKVPLVIVACGSFSPVTLLHLRMFPMALDHAKNTGAWF
jgi:hypothetical protein